jgi:hypothetical protein
MRAVTVKKRDSLRRRAPRLPPNPRFLIVCEGTVTEPCYFRAVRQVERSLIDLEIASGGQPKDLVERAVGLKKKASSDANRLADENQRYEEIWCVFDVDEHPLIPEARQQARAHGIQLAVSNPCFELWVLLHFQDQSAHITRGKVQHLCQSHMPAYAKRLNYDLLRQKYVEAYHRAVELEKLHESRGSRGGNPSTMAHILVERIRSKHQAEGRPT